MLLLIYQQGGSLPPEPETVNAGGSRKVAHEHKGKIHYFEDQSDLDAWIAAQEEVSKRANKVVQRPVKPAEVIGDSAFKAAPEIEPPSVPGVAYGAEVIDVGHVSRMALSRSQRRKAEQDDEEAIYLLLMH